MSLLEAFNQKQLQSRPKIRPGDLVKVYQRDPAKKEKKAQVFEGVVIAKRHGFGRTATFTVRRESGNVSVEKTYPLHSPAIEKLEIVQRSKVKQAKLYYLREAQGKRARLKRKNIDPASIEQIVGTEEVAEQETTSSEEPTEKQDSSAKPEKEEVAEEKTDDSNAQEKA
jgi:large subunit ribosomal protein L19